MTPKISVIIPVYNTAPWLRRCLDSVTGQTLEALEIICVNDCSPDDSLSILKARAESDSRIRLISHARNQGLSAARNTGLEAAAGEYVYFLDSDDWIDPGYIEAMLAAAEDSRCDIVMNTSIIQEYEDGRREWYPQVIDKDTVGPVSARENIDRISHTSWAYFFRKEFLDSIEARFPYGLLHEDLYFQQITLARLEEICLINSPSYHYFIREDSIMGLSKKGSNMDRVRIAEKIYEYFQGHNLLDRVKIPYFFLCHHIADIIREAPVLTAMINFFKRIQGDVEARRHLYAKMELQFLDQAISTDDYGVLMKIALSIRFGNFLPSLRRGLFDKESGKKLQGRP